MTRTMFCARCRSVQPTRVDESGGPSSLSCATCGAPIEATACEGRVEPSRRRTVLCVDDDPFVLNFCAEFLERRGFRTLVTEDGLTGVEIAKRERPDVILLDVMLRGLSGFDICRKLREESALRETPIILLTVLDSPNLSATGREAGATVIVRKPSDPETIVHAIEQVLGGSTDPARRE